MIIIMIIIIVMWYLKTTTVPVIVGALARIRKETDEHEIPGSPR